MVVSPSRIPRAWFACLLPLVLGGVSGCALHRGFDTRGAGDPTTTCVARACDSKTAKAEVCTTPCPQLRCRLWGIRCRLQGLLGDVRWLIREGVAGGPEQDIPPGPTPPPILDELFPLPTRPVFYPTPIPPQAGTADPAGAMGGSAQGQIKIPAPKADRSGDDSKARRSAEKGADGELPNRAGPEVIPTPAPLPPGDAFDSSDRTAPRKAGDMRGGWDSAGWRAAGDAVVQHAPRVAPAPPPASSQDRVAEASGNPAWVFLPAAPIAGDGPQVTVSGNQLGGGGRRQTGVRR